MMIYLGSIFVLLIVGISAEDKSVTVGNYTTKVKGQSGKIAVYKNSNESDGITITFDALEELDTNDEKIQSHSYNNFAQLDFTFSAPENSTYMDSNVSVTQFSFMANVALAGSTAKLTSYVFIFTDEGNITVDGENVTVKAGDMKFNAEIEDWPFCATCTKGNKNYTGKYLDFSVEIKGKKAPNASKDATYDLGDGATVITPKQVIFDNMTTEDMPTGYPKLITKGSKQIFVFRFRNFSKSALYDPIVSLGSDAGSDNGGSDNGGGDNSGSDTDKDMQASGVVVKVLGNSGKITLQKEGSSKNSITVQFDDLTEKKSDGNAVKESTHVTNTFANQAFAFSGLMDENYMDTSFGVKRLTFNSTLKNGADLKVHLYIFKEAGSISQENETISVQEGTVKFNIEINNWMFCNATTQCQQSEVGEYLDFSIVMKGKSGTAKKADDGTGKKYLLGDSGSTILSSKIKVDGADDLVDMATGYPMLSTKGSKQIFTFRFPKFTAGILYDPTMALNSDGTNNAVPQAISGFMLVLVSLVYRLL